MYPRCSGLTGFVLTVFLSSPVTFTITSALSSEVLHLLLSEHEFPLLHGSPKHDIKPFLWDLVQTAFDVLHGHGVLRDFLFQLFVELVIFIPTCACS